MHWGDCFCTVKAGGSRIAEQIAPPMIQGVPLGPSPGISQMMGEMFALGAEAAMVELGNAADKTDETKRKSAIWVTGED